MKYLLWIVPLLLIFAGCGKNGENIKTSDKENILSVDSADIKTTPVKDTGEKFYMRYNLELNKDYKYRVATLSSSQQAVTFDSTIMQNVKQDVIYLINVRPIELTSDSITVVNCTFTTIKLDANSNGKVYSYQSGSKLDSIDTFRYANYEALTGNTFRLNVDNKGNIMDVFQTDKIMSRYLDLVKDTISAEEMKILKEQISEGAIKPILSQIFRKMPDNIVAKDSTWKVSQNPSPYLVFSIKDNDIYKINSLEEYEDDRVAVINAELKSEITGKTDVTERGITYSFAKPVSESSGKIYFNLDKGCVQKSRTKRKLSTTFTMEGDTPTGRQKGTQTQVFEYTNIVELL